MLLQKISCNKQGQTRNLIILEKQNKQPHFDRNNPMFSYKTVTTPFNHIRKINKHTMPCFNIRKINKLINLFCHIRKIKTKCFINASNLDSGHRVNFKPNIARFCCSLSISNLFHGVKTYIIKMM